ncbi:hypothetical protein C2S53_010205 [Perilla frutescens var. hirtella]|uniref:RING-type domain-containing protein n=1 Tax=Perilla frutescens var. hirtella TaxID=608512 RepID=A0AAD4P8D8_PERFH|nr:hypothetical protein C2S53_010205 [Perilla frutescens var. hirtella]
MAVEARHLNLFPPQFVQNRENLMNPSHQGHGIHAYNHQQIIFPATLPENHSFYQQLVCDSTQPKTSINTESGLTCNFPATRKRCRDSADEFYAGVNFPAAQKMNAGVSENILPQIQQYQLEIDAVISEHTKKIRSELQQRQRQQAKMLVAAIGDSMVKTFNEKDDQIQKMATLNLMLQEKMKSLYMENQLWRDVAQTNEAAANSLRTDLQQALAQFGGSAAAEEADEVESCGSTDHGGAEAPQKVDECYSDDSERRRRCRRCGERQCSVLLLPCRHLCLCAACGSGSHRLETCPVCRTSMTATLHVNMS